MAAFLQLPAADPNLSEQERDYIIRDQEASLSVATKPLLLKIDSHCNFWAIALSALSGLSGVGHADFLVTALSLTVRHMDLKQIALSARLPFFAAGLGCIFGGFLVQFHRRGLTLINSCRARFTFGALIMIVIGFVGIVESPYAALTLRGVAGFAHQTLSVTVITMSSDLFPRSEVATVAGMAGVFGNLGVLLFSLAIGGLVTSIGYSPFFVFLGVLDLAGAALRV